MRDIKFRVWNGHREVMIYKGGFFTTFVYIDEKGKMQTQDDAILLQYTGLKDVNGKEIYEGDIVEGLVMFQDNLVEVKGVVKFVHGRFVIAEYNCSLYEFANIPSKKSNEIEVIGNKYDNPELLGGE